MANPVKPPQNKGKSEEYPKEQLWKIYNSLPQELQEAIFSEETSNSISNICQKNNLEKEMSDIAELIGYVILGLLAPEEFNVFLEKKLGIKEEIAKKTAREINRFIFYPIKPALDQLYGKERVSLEGKETLTEEKNKKIDLGKKGPTDKYLEPFE